MTTSRHNRLAHRLIAGAVFASCLSRAATAQVGPDLRFPHLAPYEASVAQALASLHGTNLHPFIDAVLPVLGSNTVALNEEAFLGMARCRAALPLFKDAALDRLDAVVLDNDLGLRARDAAHFTAYLVRDNFLVGYEGLVAQASLMLSNALASTRSNLTALAATLDDIDGLTLPACLFVGFGGPPDAAPGERVELTVEVWNAGDAPATNVLYRFREDGDAKAVPRSPVQIGDLAAGARDRHLFHVRVPESTGSVSYTVTITADHTAPQSSELGIRVK